MAECGPADSDLRTDTRRVDRSDYATADREGEVPAGHGTDD